jgi:hypothetical protein
VEAQNGVTNMTIAIMIWLITIFTSVWVIFRAVHVQVKLSQVQSKDIEEHGQQYLIESIAKTAILFVVLWWIAFMLHETVTIRLVNYTFSYNWKLLSLTVITPVFFMIYHLFCKSVYQRYHVYKNDRRLSFELPLGLIMGLIYGLLISYSIETMIIFIN